MSGEVNLKLSRDQALVLFAWLARFNDLKDERFEDQAEQRVLWDLEASLESILPEPFRPDFGRLLQDARSRVRDSRN